MITTIISVLLFFILPIFLGRPIVRLLHKKELTHPFISYFVTGSFVIYISLFLGFSLKPFIPVLGNLSSIQEIIFAVSFIVLPLNIIVDKDDFSFGSYILPALLSLLLSSIGYFIWQFHAPISFNWDMYEHQTLTNSILNGHVSVIPSTLTDTFGFNGYSTLFHSLVAASQTFTKPDILQFWTAISFLHFTLAIFASYLLSREITDNKYIGVISAIITAFIFDSSISFTTLFFIPQTFTAVLFVFIFTQLIKELKNGRIPALLLVLMQALFIFINHYVVGFIGGFMYAGFYLYARFSRLIESKISSRNISQILLFLAFVGVIFSSSIPLGFINSGEAKDYTLTIVDKFNIMKQSYGYLLLLLLPIGIFSSMRSSKKIEKIVLVITLLLVSVVLMQIPYTVKFYTITRFFVDFLIAVGIYALLKHMHMVFKIASIIALAICLAVVFVINASVWKGILHYENAFTQVSNSEISASEFLKKTYGKTGAFLVSDPATQNIMEPISTVNSQAGAYMNTQTRKILDSISKTENPGNVAALLYKINDKIDPTTGPRLFILSGRYFLWQKASNDQKLSFSYNIWSPEDLTLEDISKVNLLLSDRDHFRLVYSNKGLAIVEVKK